MRHLFKQVKVILNVYESSYEVYYKNWFLWNFVKSFKFCVESENSKANAETNAIRYAECLFETIEVFRK